MDAKTIAGGVPSIDLMERAADGVARLVLKDLVHSTRNTNILVLCGPGNNGGDGAAISRILKDAGCSVTAVAAYATGYSPDFIRNIGRLREVMVYGGDASFGTTVSHSSFERLIRSSQIIIDCLLGTGQRGAPRGIIGEMCQMISEQRDRAPVTVISVDTPTGINASSGEVHLPCVKADHTIAIQCIKRGLVQYPARDLCGRIDVVDIGIHTGTGTQFSLFHPSRTPFISRVSDAHKGNFRKVMVVSGVEEMRGASILASHAALRSGTPLVTRMIPGKQTISSIVWPEIMHARIPTLSAKSIKDFLKKLTGDEVIVLGPGLGTSPGASGFVTAFIKEAEKSSIPFVLDADALNCLAALPRRKTFTLSSGVITPHPGEAARLLSVTPADIQRDRYFSAHALFQKTDATILLKGASSIVFNGVRGSVNPSGNPFLATGGSGDVLCGIVASFISQGASNYEAAQWGAYIHGRAGDIAHGKHHGPIRAHDIIEALPEAIGEVVHG